MKRTKVICLIGVAAGVAVLTFMSIGVVSTHGRITCEERANSEVRCLAAALEAYRVDHDHYPTDTATTEHLNPNTTYDPAAYVTASAFLYRSLTGEGSPNPDGSHRETYLSEATSSSMRSASPTGATYFVDPWGNSFGYSTFKSVHPDSPDGNNPTFDLWSTGGGKSQADVPKWIKNW